MSEILRLDNLSTGYAEHGERRIVSHGLTAELPQGQLTCLLGTNGTGKSTLFRTLAGFQPTLKGEVWLEGRHLEDWTARERAQRIGVVLTDRLPEARLSVREMVGIGRSPYTGFWGTLEAADYEVVEQSIRQAGIATMAERLVSSLSDGERQKVLIAKTLAQETPLIFLDEPTAFLDFPSKLELMRLLRSLAHESGKTILLSTHDLELALQTADGLWLLTPDGGFHRGTPRSLAADGLLDAFFTSGSVTFDRQTLQYQFS